MSDNESDLIEVPSFDERTTRRAVQRAILRTAFTAAVAILVVLAVVGAASAGWAARGKNRMYFVLGRAYQVANPGYIVNFSGPGHSRLDFGTEMTGGAQALEPGGFSSSGTTVTIRQRFYGHVSDLTRPTMTDLDALFCCISRSDTERVPQLLADLPKAVVMSALVELKQPLGEDAFTAFRHRLGICAGGGMSDTFRLRDGGGLAMFERESKENKGCRGMPSVPKADLASMLLSPTPQVRAEERFPGSGDGSHRLAWPDYSLDEFNRWAETLRSSDDRNLREFLLPRSSEIKRRAKEGKIYGFILTGLRPALLRELVKAPELGDLTIAGIALAVS